MMALQTRHMALLTYAGIAALAMVIKPELLTSLQDVILLLAPIGGMFVWDKIKGGSIVKN